MDELTGLAIEREQGPSWARPNWPVAELDSVNLGLDPTEATIEEVAETAKAAAVATGTTDEASVRRSAEDSIRAMMLIRTYRVRGHLAANLDPLGLHRSELLLVLFVEELVLQRASALFEGVVGHGPCIQRTRRGCCIVGA
jgi:2-oxoglutarate dehydrogenase E1 component